jgi:flagellin
MARTTMLNSINTNAGAMIALQNLNATNSELQTTQGNASTPARRVSNAKDNGAIWSMAKMQSATSSSLNAVKDSLQRGQSTIDVGLAAGDTITDLLGKMKEKALAASDTSLNTASFKPLSDFESLRDQITKAVYQRQVQRRQPRRRHHHQAAVPQQLGRRRLHGERQDPVAHGLG